MNFFRKLKPVVMASALAAILSTFGTGIATPAYAHDAKCPFCKLDVVQDTKELDNEVKLRLGNKRLEYRCVMCAIAHTKAKHKGDVTILAPSTVKGKPVTITRTAGEWKVEPETAVFAFQKGTHAKCQDLYRALTSKDEFDKYAKAKGLKEAEALTLTEMIERSK